MNHLEHSNLATQPEQANKSGFWIALIGPLSALAYFLQLDAAFLESMDYVVGGAKLEHDLYLKPRLDTPNWGDHYIYRTIANVICIGGATFVSGGLTRTHGKLGGIFGGLGISAYMCLLLYVYFFYNNVDIDRIHLIITGVLVILSPLIGAFAGELGSEVSTSKMSGFAGIPRLHFLWFWLPTYWYSLALIGPLVNLYGIAGSFNFISYTIRLIPVVLYGAPLVFGLGIMSGDYLEDHSRLFRQTIGPLVLIGGFFMLSLLQFAIYKAIVD